MPRVLPLCSVKTAPKKVEYCVFAKIIKLLNVSVDYIYWPFVSKGRTTSGSTNANMLVPIKPLVVPLYLKTDGIQLTK